MYSFLPTTHSWRTIIANEISLLTQYIISNTTILILNVIDEFSLQLVLLKGLCRSKPVLKAVSLGTILALALRPLSSQLSSSSLPTSLTSVASNASSSVDVSGLDLLSKFIMQFLSVPAVVHHLSSMLPDVSAYEYIVAITIEFFFHTNLANLLVTCYSKFTFHIRCKTMGLGFNFLFMFFHCRG